MEIRLLGPLEVVGGDGVVLLPRRKQQALLAVLALHVNEPLSADRLVEDIWGDRPPATARGALQNYVSQLRGVFGADRIARRPAGYVLVLDEECVDVVRFRRMAAQARATTDVGDRAATARAALALWRGPALPELAYEPFAAFELPPLEDERRDLHADLIDAELALGRHAYLVEEIEALVEASPYDERLRRQLMLALYRAGRQAEALAVYQDVRRVLVDELGIDPSRELRVLEQQILAQDTALDIESPRLPAVEPVRRTVTVLLAGLPEPPEAIDAEELNAREARLFEQVRGAAEYHGGTARRLTVDATMAVFGLPTAHEDDALRALRAAAAVQPIGKVGIATGDVYAEGSGEGGLRVTGAAVIAARRLEQAAQPGSILLSGATLALVRDAVRVRRSADAAAAFRLERIVEGAAPVERRLDVPLVDRVEELAALRDAFAGAMSERRCCVQSVVGEAGIGKTRLARELVAEVAGEATVLTGRCVSYGEGATYLPLSEMLAAAGDDLEPLLASATSTGEERLLLRRYFESRARDRPLVLVFDDVHWAEPTLLDLIDYLGEHVEEAPILVLGLSRPELPERGHPIIRLKPLADEHTQAFVAALGGSGEPGVDERIVGVAEGNPLYAEQLLAFAAETGTLDAVPPTLDGLLQSRLDRLPSGERHVLQRAAVVGRDFAFDAVAHLCAPEFAATLDERLAALTRAGLTTVAADGYRFHHGLIRDAAYATLPKADRAELHERLADRLDEAADELVGYHLEQAALYRRQLDPVDRRGERLAAAAGDKLGTAGLGAWKRGDAPAAVNLLTRAVDLLPEKDAFRFELMCELGVASRGAGDLGGAESILSCAAVTAREVGERRFELRARLELANVRLFTAGGSADELLHVAEEGIPVFEAVRDDHARARAWRLTAYVEGAMRCRYARSAEAAERAFVSELGTGWSRAAILGDLAAALYYGPTPVPHAIRRCAKLLEEADLGGEANVLPFLAGLEAIRDALPRARELLDRAERLYAELGQRTFGLVSCTARRADVERAAGDIAAVEEALRRKHAALESMRDRVSLATCAAELATVVLDAGRVDEAKEWSGVAEELASRDDVPTQFLSRSVRARLLAHDGETQAAEALAREAVALAETTDSISQRAEVLLSLADVLRLGARGDAAVEAGSSALALFEQKRNSAGARRARALLAELAPA
jgi:DNA-binding SARP family transcriptional activator